MYFWNTRALAHELSQNSLTKRDYKNYYLAAALVVSAVYYYGMYSPYADLRVIGFEGLLTLIIMFIGIERVYQANGGDQGEQFLNRVTALSFPILLQTTLAGVVFGIILLVIYQYFGLESTAFDAWYEWCVSAFTLALQLLFFTRLIRYIKRVKQGTI